MARATDFAPGAHTFNYVDKPDLSMQAFADVVYRALEQRPITRLRIPYSVGYVAGLVCDLAGSIAGVRLPVSANRVRKFCTTTTYSADRLARTGFVAPVSHLDALMHTIKTERASGSL